MNELARLKLRCRIEDWWRDHGATLATWLLIVSLIGAGIGAWSGKFSSDDAASVGRKLDKSTTEQACRTEYAAKWNGARSRLDDARSKDARLQNASWRAFIAKDEAALKALTAPMREVDGLIGRRNADQLAANGQYQNLLRAQRTDAELFAAMCKTGPPPS